MLAAIAVIVALLGAGSALAWFTASTSGSARISTGAWADLLTFAPGCSRAAHWSSPGRPRFEPVARRVDHGVSLDFGDARPNADLSWCDVLRVTSTAPDPLSVSFVVTGTIAPFVGGVWFTDGAPADLLGPAQTRRLGVRLIVPKRTPYGAYTGTLAVAVAGEAERYEFPLSVTVGKRGHQPPGPAAGTFVLPHGSPAGSPTPPPPDASPSPSPTASPSPSPSAPPLAPLFSLLPGTSTALPAPDPGAEPVAVARLLPEGGIALGFGVLPAGQEVVFPDVLRVTSAVGRAATVTLALAGPPADAVMRVGLWDEERGLVTGDLTLDAGAEVQVGFAFDLPADAEPGLREGTLTLNLTLDDGSCRQQCEVPLTLAIQPSQASPSAAASP